MMTDSHTNYQIADLLMRTSAESRELAFMSDIELLQHVCNSVLPRMRDDEALSEEASDNLQDALDELERAIDTFEDADNEFASLQSDIVDEFDEDVRPRIEEQYGADDVIALREAWNDWTDMLARDGCITQAACDRLDHPSL